MNKLKKTILSLCLILMCVSIVSSVSAVYDNGIFCNMTNEITGIDNAGNGYHVELNQDNNQTNKTIFSNNLVKYYHNDSDFEVTIVDKDGKHVSHAWVVFSINGKEYTRVTDGNGVAKLNIDLTPGNYTITTKNTLNNETVTNNITVKSILVDNKDLKIAYRDGSAYTVKLLDGQGHHFANKTVNFEINGKVYHRTTDVYGVAKLNINLNPGNYRITAEYDGCKVSNWILVFHP